MNVYSPIKCLENSFNEIELNIKSNYLTGLNPAEYFFHAMSGRIGVISTAIKTATTGYTQRKLMKIMEDLQVRYDGTVRNARNFIVS